MVNYNGRYLVAKNKGVFKNNARNYLAYCKMNRYETVTPFVNVKKNTISNAYH